MEIKTVINDVLTPKEKYVDGKSTRTFSYLNDQIVGFIDRTAAGSEAFRVVLTDIQGSVTEVYDDDCKLLWKSDYTAFGIKAGETTDLIDFDGLYTGCDYDSETGLTYHWNRWRSEDGANFITQDPARDGRNWYIYCVNNPLICTDPNGLETTVMIIHANSGWERIGKGSHVAIHFSNPGKDKFGEDYGEIIYDPAGSYGKDINVDSQGDFYSDENGSLEKFISSVENRAIWEYEKIYEFAPTPEQENEMVEQVINSEDDIAGMCAFDCSAVLRVIGFHISITPGGVEKQAQHKVKLQQKNE